jgi:hypothetical protein
MREDSTSQPPPLALPETPPDSAHSSRTAAAIALLRAWREGDEAEQRDTLTYLKMALDADRLSDRKLFPA